MDRDGTGYEFAHTHNNIPHLMGFHWTPTCPPPRQRQLVFSGAILSLMAVLAAQVTVRTEELMFFAIRAFLEVEPISPTSLLTSLLCGLLPTWLLTSPPLFYLIQSCSHCSHFIYMSR